MSSTRWNGSIFLAVVCALALGLASAFGDWLWSRYIPDGHVGAGVTHGVILFLLLALLLSWAAGTRVARRRLLLTLPLAGLLIAAAFYPIALAVGYLGGLLASWFLMWIALAQLQRWARVDSESLGAALSRALAAAILSGLAFWSISGIWTQPQPDPNYVVRIAQWSWAFLPGFLALLIGQKPAREI